MHNNIKKIIKTQNKFVNITGDIFLIFCLNLIHLKKKGFPTQFNIKHINHIKEEQKERETAASATFRFKIDTILQIFFRFFEKCSYFSQQLVFFIFKANVFFFLNR